MKKVIAILPFLLYLTLANAQGLIQKVNAIKESDDYIWEQYAHTSEDTALVKAIEWLTIDVDKLEHIKVTAEELKPYVKHILLKGKAKVRAFVYMKKSDASAAIKAIKGQKAKSTYKPDSLTLELLALKDIYAAHLYFEKGLKSGSIGQYGSPKNTDNIDDKHLILFNQDNLAPILVLSPVTEGERRINLLTGQDDSFNRHHGCYAIWFTINQK